MKYFKKKCGLVAAALVLLSAALFAEKTPVENLFQYTLDNGLSLFNFAMQDDIDHLDEYAKTRANPYGIPYETVCKEVMGNKQRVQLHKLINFHFMRHPSINLPEERLIPIEKHIQKRVRELLALPKQ